MEINLGDGSLTCCDVASLEEVDCTASIESRKRREVSTIIRAQNRPLPANTSFTYYVLTSTPNGEETLYGASSRSGPFIVTQTLNSRWSLLVESLCELCHTDCK